MHAVAAGLVPERWGDSAVLFTALGGDADARWRAALDLHRALGAAVPEGVTDWIHAFESVLVQFDCTVTSSDAVTAAIARLDPPAASAVPPRHFRIPVRFGGEDGPDLVDAAAEAGLTAAALVDYLVSGDLVIGTVGGNALPLMQRPGQPFTVSRMRSPRPRVPAGSLGLAGDRTCFYSVDAPGGWRLVGRTPVRLTDLTSETVVPYAAGDTVRLHAVSDREWARLAGATLAAEPLA